MRFCFYLFVIIVFDHILTRNLIVIKSSPLPLQMSPPMSGTMQHSTVRNGMPTSAQSQQQHKRSLSFNHHLNYNQYQMQQQGGQGQLQHTTQQPQSLQGNVSSSFNSTYQPYQTPPARPNHNPYQTLRDAGARTTPPVGNQKGEQLKESGVM